MSALCYILMLLIFITLPTLIYTLFHVIKCPPSARPPPPTDASLKPGLAIGQAEPVTVVDVAELESTEGEARGDCPVCLSPFEDEERLWQLKSCRHHFHAPCIEPWLHVHSSCPVCRAYVFFPKRSPAVPAPVAARESDLWQGMPDSAGLV